MGKPVEFCNYSFAAADAAQSFVKNYFREAFQVEGKPFHSGLVNLGNGYFVRLFAQKDFPNRRDGSFLFTPYVMGRDGKLNLIHIKENKDGRYDLFETVPHRGMLFLKTDKDIDGYYGLDASEPVSFRRVVNIMERFSRFEPSSGVNVSISDPDFLPLELKKMPWREAVAECEQRRPVLVDYLFDKSPSAEVGMVRDAVNTRCLKTLSLILDQKKLG